MLVLASASSDKTVKIWNRETGVCVLTLRGHANFVMSLEVLSLGRLASGSIDDTIKIWDAETGACLLTIQSPNATRDNYRFYKSLKLLNNSTVVRPTYMPFKYYRLFASPFMNRVYNVFMPSPSIDNDGEAFADDFADDDRPESPSTMPLGYFY